MYMKTETLNWIIEQINNTKGLVRVKKTKEKFIGFLNLVNEFSDENQNITKKELTQIANTFDNVCGTYYGLLKGDDFQGNKYEIYDKLAQKRGKDSYISFYGDVTATVNVLSNLHVYGLSSIKHNLKNIDGVKFNAGEKKFLAKYYPNMDKWYELHLKIESIRKIQNPTKEEKEARKLIEIKGKVNPNLKSAIDDIAENFRQVIEENQLSYYNGIIEKFKEECPTGVTSGMFRNKTISCDFQTILRRYLVSVVDGVKYNHLLSSDYKSKLVKDVYNYSVDVIRSWQIKMYDKLGGDFIGSMSQDFTTSVSGSRYTYNDIYFDFADSSHFTLRNQLVSKFSNKGTFFYTYPTTFHDAYLPDGTAVAYPDEYTVKKAFQNYYNG